jgi:hypothetical protein
VSSRGIVVDVLLYNRALSTIMMIPTNFYAVYDGGLGGEGAGWDCGYADTVMCILAGPHVIGDFPFVYSILEPLFLVVDYCDQARLAVLLHGGQGLAD